MCAMRVACPAHLIVYDLITEIIFGESLNYEAPHYANLSILPSPLLCENLRIGSLSSLSIYFLPLGSDATFHVYTE